MALIYKYSNSAYFLHMFKYCGVYCYKYCVSDMEDPNYINLEGRSPDCQASKRNSRVTSRSRPPLPPKTGFSKANIQMPNFVETSKSRSMSEGNPDRSRASISDLPKRSMYCHRRKFGSSSVDSGSERTSNTLSSSSLSSEGSKSVSVSGVSSKSVDSVIVKMTETPLPMPPAVLVPYPPIDSEPKQEKSPKFRRLPRVPSPKLPHVPFPPSWLSGRSTSPKRPGVQTPTGFPPFTSKDIESKSSLKLKSKQSSPIPSPTNSSPKMFCKTDKTYTVPASLVFGKDHPGHQKIKQKQMESPPPVRPPRKAMEHSKIVMGKVRQPCFKIISIFNHYLRQLVYSIFGLLTNVVNGTQNIFCILSFFTIVSKRLKGCRLCCNNYFWKHRYFRSGYLRLG